MQKKIKVNNCDIAYTLRSSKRAKRVRLAVYPDGSVIVTKPWWFSNSIVERFIQQKSEWITSRVELFKKKGITIIPSNKRSYQKHKEKKT